ncbi:tRNA (adenosine(37)-N6)-threonylcarbamoyltransferase complex dimerization subunit type 1 TsaB [Marivirga arenosa]|uniref:tRNA (Adenosine(37)-N6)-threonylcarbamoyltransferase complex dimerization subunit type 1 TsaB n=1 Tax=Marivirga arenosa TaxID=3059076 RepID=A0AA49JEB8_9BACT|nr:tRNA (adenosine(37)-N6)-threonylcarbamoyltransferase complex dimerization subunit type 1 TsaB [Marivirga sp. ABR2-2]WKK87660.2 tRNA (adenosine(37)-N6)-threonylcarbamoyltransferase complex dimerization subunit type 1 TsaB [Marivirga sp. ABR2-2]
MSFILSIETSTPICSVAIHKEGELMANTDLFLEKSHSNSLTPLIEELLQHCDLNMSDLSAVAVSSGPGSYTGLRIGLSTAKGLCYALDIPLLSISSLDSMTSQVINFDASENICYIPMIDARRMEVFYKVSGHNLKGIEKMSNLIIEEDSFNNLIESYNKVYLFGNGSLKAYELLKNVSDKFTWIKGIDPTAKFYGEMAYEKFKQEQFEDLAYFEPNYGKEFYSPKSKKKSFLDLNR